MTTIKLTPEQISFLKQRAAYQFQTTIRLNEMIRTGETSEKALIEARAWAEEATFHEDHILEDEEEWGAPEAIAKMRADDDALWNRIFGDAEEGAGVVGELAAAK